MDAEKSLLTEIRAIEDECSRKLEGAKKHSEETIASAQQEAARKIDRAESTGAEAAREYLETELRNIRTETEKIREAGASELDEARMKGEKNLTDALQKIMKAVVSE